MFRVQRATPSSILQGSRATGSESEGRKYALESSAGDQPRLSACAPHATDSSFFSTNSRGRAGCGPSGVSEAMQEELRQTENRWLALRAYVDEILGNQSAILSIREFVQVINAATPQLQQASEDVVRILVRSQAEPQQVYVASRQLMLAQRLGDNVSRVLDGGARTAAAIDQFSQDADRVRPRPHRHVDR